MPQPNAVYLRGDYVKMTATIGAWLSETSLD